MNGWPSQQKINTIFMSIHCVDLIEMNWGVYCTNIDTISDALYMEVESGDLEEQITLLSWYICWCIFCSWLLAFSDLFCVCVDSFPAIAWNTCGASRKYN